ncbi:MAG: competence/damage-inducible protein A [Clostridia bacterium]
MNAEIISVGTELLLGKVVNTDTTIVAKELSGIGVNLLHASTVGDNPQRLKEAVELALSRSDLLITTGGLGPTQDDLTKETVAKAAGLNLKFHEESYKRLCTQFPNGMTQNQINQVMLPENCDVLLNDNGTAPGCVFKTLSDKLVMMFPGPPSELEPMLKNYALPYLLKGNEGAIVSHNIHVFGLGEAPVAEYFDYLMNNQNPTVAPYADEGEMYLRITAKAPTEEEAHKLCEPIIAEITEKIGDFVYSVDTKSLEAVLVAELKKQGKTIATAESCTGGLLAKRITDISGSSDVFETGVVSYANKTKTKLLGVSEEILKEHGAVSAECAKAMAEGMLKLSGADIAISTTGIAGPNGGTTEKPVGLVYMAVTDGKNTYVGKRNPIGRFKVRDWHRYVACSHLFDMARRLLQGHEVCAVEKISVANIPSFLEKKEIKK